MTDAQLPPQWTLQRIRDVSGEQEAVALDTDRAVKWGWMIDEPGANYRRHSKQQTAQPAHWDPAERAALDEVLLPRLEAMRSLGWRWSPSQGMTATGELS